MLQAKGTRATEIHDGDGGQAVQGFREGGGRVVWQSQYMKQVGEDLFGSTVLEKNKKYAEQGAALVAVKCLDITEKSIVWKEKETSLEISNGHKVS